MPRIELVEDTPEKVVYRVLAAPFGSPTRKDFSGEFFHEKTDFGDMAGIKTKFGFYEHNINPMVNPHQAPAVHAFLGKSTFDKIDESGRWVLFEIERSNEYLPIVQELYKQNRLGASTQAYYGTKSVDPSVPGKIDSWWESEVSLTPTPDNPDTIFTEAELKALVKSVAAPAVYERLYKTVAELPVEAKAEADIYVSISADVASESVGGIVDQVEALLAAAPDAPPEMDIMECIAVALAPINAMLAEMMMYKSKAEAELVEMKAAHAKEIEDLKAGLKTTATFVNKKMTDLYKTAQDMSQKERDIFALPDLTKTITPPPAPPQEYTYQPRRAQGAFGDTAPGARKHA